MKNTIAANADDQPERRKASAEGGWTDSITSFSGDTKTFLGDVRGEMRRVNWPSFKQIRATTVVVIVTVFLFGAYFGFLDWLFNIVIRRLLRIGL